MGRFFFKLIVSYSCGLFPAQQRHELDRLLLVVTLCHSPRSAPGAPGCHPESIPTTAATATTTVPRPTIPGATAPIPGPTTTIPGAAPAIPGPASTSTTVSATSTPTESS